jgi:hypothetical protein
MDGILFQDYVTISGSGSPVTLTQGSDSWLDISPYEDLVFYLDVKNATAGIAQISYQTSPTREDPSFLNMIAPLSLAIGLRTDAALAANCQVPAAAYLRWQVIGAPGMTYTATFRIILGAYSLEC